jgi:hypothetical protein
MTAGMVEGVYSDAPDARMLDWLRAVSPRVEWVRSHGEFRGSVRGGCADVAARRVERLAERLQLTPGEPCPGWLVWTGTVGTWQLRLYAPDLGRS